MKKRIIALLIAALAVVSAGCTAGEKSSGSETSSASESSRKISPKSKEKRKIIIDTDTAGDDAVAMIIAAKTENVEILGVTVSEGNVGIEQAVKNALMTLEVAGCDAPVYRGASKSYTGKTRETFSVYGKDGRGDNDLIHPTRTAEDKGAVDFIIETVNANPGEVEIIALGPVTNIALAMDKNPGAMKRVKKYWSMGTCGFGAGNASPVSEFNKVNWSDTRKYITYTCPNGMKCRDNKLHEEKYLKEAMTDEFGIRQKFAERIEGSGEDELSAGGSNRDLRFDYGEELAGADTITTNADKYAEYDYG